MAKKDIPDSARAWAIAFAACVISALLSGITRTTGLLYVELIDTFGISRFQANLPFTVRNIVRNLGGPLVGVIGQRFGPRNVTMVGGALASLGILLCAFAPNIVWLTFLWGGMHGLGVALANTLCQVVVTQHFIKHRATASGLGFSGACFSSFVLPVLMGYMLRNVGLFGAFIITGGLVMHVLPAAIILKEPSWIQRKTKDISTVCDSILKTSSSIEKKSLALGSSSIKHKNAFDDNIKQCSSFGSSDLEQEIINTNCNANFNSRNNGINNPAFIGSRTSLKDINTLQVDEEEKHVPMTNLRISSVKADKLDLINQESSIYHAVRKMISDSYFHMISLSLAASAMMVDPVLTTIVDYSMDKGFKEEQAEYFIIAMSIGDLTGKLGFGWVTDKKYMSVANFMAFTLISEGVIFFFLTFSYDFYIFMILITLFGVTTGACLVMFPVLISMYLPSVQSLSIGSTSLLLGLVNLSVPSLIGYFRDEVGSYDGMFYITAGSSVAVGFLWPLLGKFKPRLQKKSNASTAVTS